MDFATWEPVYAAILADMGYDRADDERARDRLASLVGDAETLTPDAHSFEGETVAIAAPGPNLDADVALVEAADSVVAAGVAGDRLLDLDLPVDWIVTDLDGHPDGVGRFTDGGGAVAVHAHGDNVDRLEAAVPTLELSAVLPTTQAAPTGPVYNLGGFTDGDRAAFLADALGADRLTFPGWDLADPDVGDEKRRKLEWAARLLYWLENRRGERFQPLNGRREAIDASPLPIDG